MVNLTKSSQRVGTAEWPTELFERVTDIIAEALVLDYKQSAASFHAVENTIEPVIDSRLAWDDNWPDNVWYLDRVGRVQHASGNLRS